MNCARISENTKQTVTNRVSIAVSDLMPPVRASARKGESESIAPAAKKSRTHDSEQITLAETLLGNLNRLIPTVSPGKWKFVGKTWLIPSAQKLALLTREQLQTDIADTSKELVRRAQAKALSESQTARPMLV